MSASILDPTLRTANRTVMSSYATMNHWRAYQSYLPERMRLTEDRLPDEEWYHWRGGQYHLDRFAAPDSPVTVVLLHGGGGNGRLLAPYGALLHAHGYEAVLPDLPGYGLSRAAPEHFSYSRWVDFASDLVQTEIDRSHRPVVLFGLSVGGYLAYMTAARSGLVSGVIATTLADPRLPIVRDQFARNPRLNRLLAPLLGLTAPLANLRLPVKWFCNMQALANDRDFSRLLCNDPVGGGNRVSLRFMRSLFTVRPAIEPENFDACPILLMQPAADRWTTLEASLPFFDRIKGAKQLVMLENCGHLPIEEPGISQLESSVVSFLRGI